MATRAKKSIKRISRNKPREVLWQKKALRRLGRLEAKVRASRLFRWLGTALGSQPLTAIVGLVAAASILGSISYAMGYLFTIDLSLIALFSLQDIISISIPAVPIISLVLVFNVIINAFLINPPKPESNGSTNEVARRGVLIKRRFRELHSISSVRYSINAIAIILAIVFVFFVSPRVLVISTVLMVGLTVALRQFAKKEMLISMGFVACIAYLNIVLWTFAMFGSLNAQWRLTSSSRNYLVMTQDMQYDVMLLATTSDFLIVRDDPRTVRVIPRRLVNEIKILEVGRPRPLLSFSQIWRYFFPLEQRLNGR